MDGAGKTGWRTGPSPGFCDAGNGVGRGNSKGDTGMALTTQITRLSISGFKSIHEWHDYRPGPLNVLIGPNGAGKSNLISFFRMLSWMAQGKLAFHAADKGASFLLFDGPSVTKEIRGEIELSTQSGITEYAFTLFHVAGRDEFIFADERFRHTPINRPKPNEWTGLGSGHKESALIEAAEVGPEPSRATARTILGVLRGLRIHQFHNTSETARLKNSWLVNDSWSLKEDGGNLAPFLLRLREEAPENYRRIVAHCRQLLPFFDDFVLIEKQEKILLQWKELGSDMVFDTSVASDGMLRVLALLSLLCQPNESMQEMLFLDEPELGLHPSAIQLVGALLQVVSQSVQVFVATQSPYLLNEFETEQVTVLERRGRESDFKQLSSEELALWLDEYSLADLWWKNVLGGKP